MYRKITVAVLAIMATFWSGLTAQTLTVAGGSDTEQYIPVYGYYMDVPQRSQTIYPDSMLTEMSGKYITELTYYFNTAPTRAWGGIQTVKIGVTTATDLGNGFVATPSTLVWTGTLSANISNNEMHLLLDRPLLYSGGNLLIEIENPTAATWISATFAGQNQTSQMSYMTWQNNTHGANFLPMLTFTYVTSGCFNPYNLTATQSDNSVLFTWSQPPYCSASNFIVEYKSAFDTAFTEEIVTDTFLTVNNLTNNASYQWRVRTHCNDDNYSNWFIGPNFSTPPVIAHVPYICDFENFEESTQWTFINGNGQNKWWVGTATQHSGTHSMYVSYDQGVSYGYTSGATYIWAYRDIDFDSIYDGHRLSFVAKNYSYTNNMNHGFMKVYLGPPATPGNNTSNAPTGAVNLGSDIFNQSSWKTYSFLLDSTYQGVYRLYFCWMNNNTHISNPPGAIDDISVESYNCMMPEQLTTTNIDTTSAVVTWHAPLIGTASYYTLAYRTLADSDFTTVTLTDTSFTLTGLDIYTQYEWKVRSHCSSTDQSDWSETKQFITEPPIAEFPYFCDFEDSLENHYWRMVNMEVNGWHIGSATAQSGNQSLYVSNDGGITNAISEVNYSNTIWAYRDIQFPVGYANYQISLDYKGLMDAWSNPKVMIGSPHNAPSLSAYEPSGSTLLTYFESDTVWKHYTFLVDSTFAGVQRIYFGCSRPTALRNPAAAIDNLTIVGNACPRVHDLQNITVQDTFALLAWGSVGADSYTVAYKSTSDTAYTEIQTNDTVLRIGGLNSTTSYVWRVRSHCSDSTESYWSDALSFTTKLPIAFLPYFCDFEDSVENAIWQLTPNSGDNKTYIGNAVAYNEGHSLYITKDNGVTNSYTPNSTNPEASRNIYFTPEYPKYLISFDCKGGGDETGVMQVFLDNTLLSNHLSNAGFWTHQSIIVDSSFSGYHQLRLRFEYNTTWNPAGAFDNISIKGIFHEPLTNLTTTNITYHSAQLSWTSDSSKTPLSYRLAWRSQSDSTYSEVLLYASDTTYTLANLGTSSWYVWKVQALYSDNEWSDWSGEMAFKTLAQLPYFCDFENELENQHWTIRIGDYSNGSSGYYSNHTNKWYIGTPSEIADNNKMLYISSDNGVTNSYEYGPPAYVWAYRDIYFDPGYPEYQLSLDFKGMGEEGYDYVRLFLDTPLSPPLQSDLPVPLVQIGEDLNLISQWTHKSFTIDSTHAGAQRLYILWTNNLWTGANPPAAIDNISINVATCGVPDNLVSSPQDTAATISWSPNSTGNASSYILAYKMLSESFYTELTTQDTFFTIHGLVPNTDYFWKVRSVCGATDTSEWSGDAFFTTTQQLPHLPYLCSFDNPAENSHWTIANSDATNQWVIGNATGYGDNNALYISNDSGTTNAYTITSTSSVWAYRDVYFDENYLAYQLSFDFNGNGQSNTDYMKVFVGAPSVPSGTATPEGAVQLGAPLFDVNDWAHYSFTLDSTYAGVQRIYFLWVNNNSMGVQPPAAVDNLSVCGLACFTPSDLAIMDMTATEATLSWSSSSLNMSTSYTVSVRPAGSTVTSEFTTTDTFYVVNGLAPSAIYYCKVRANCSTNEQSGWSSDVCARMPASIPYYCDFENAQERNVWQMVNGTYTNKWYVSEAVSNGGDYSMYISNNGGVSYSYTYGYSSYVWAYRDIYFDPSDSVYSLSFDYQGAGGTSSSNSAYTNVYLGAPVNPNGSTIPEGLTALATGLSGMPAWTNNTYTLDHSHAGLQRLYFYWRNTGWTASNPPAAIDNIIIEGTPCANVPTALTVQVMDTLANLSWTLANGSADSYTVAYKFQNDSVYTYLTVPDEHVTVGNLTPLTTYVWKVRANCTATDHSFWSAEVSFQTPENTARVPYICDFEDITENSHWQFFNGSNTNKWYIDSAVNNGGTHSLYVSNDNGATNAYTVNSSSRVWACRDIYFEPNYSQFLISFDFKGLGENYSGRAYDFAKLFIGPAISPNTSYGASYSPQGSTQIGTYLYQQNDWTTIQDTLNMVSETGLQRIYFLWENDGFYGDNPPVAIDNFSIVPFGCGRPLNPVTSDLSANSATLSWDGTTADFEVAYKLTSDTVYTTLITSEHSVTLGNLISDSEYEWKVKTICSDSSESEWSATVFFTTYQNIAHLPYFCDFENDFENSNWAVVSGNMNQWTIGDAVSNGGSRSLYVTADSGTTNSYTHNSTYSIWAYRDIYFDEGFAEYELEFDYKGIGCSDHYGNVYIGTPAIPHPESNVAPVGATLLTQKLYDKSEWTHYSITLDATHAGAQRLYFLWTVTNTSSNTANPPAAIDNVAVAAHNCVKPQNLQSANVTSNTASVSWTHASGNSFVVAYRVTGSSLYEEVQTDQNSLILTDLLSSTTYAWKVKAVCSSSEESAWSPEATFTTNYFVAQLPYINGFEDEYENNQWRYFYQNTNPTRWTFGNATNNGGSNAFYISIDGGVTNTYSGGYYDSWAWRDIYIDSATTQIQISFDYKGVGYAHPYGSDYGRLLFGVPTTPYYVNTEGITDLTGELKLIPDWTHYHYVVDVSNITGVRRIYLHWHTENSQGSNPAAFDNLTIVAGDCGLPTNLTVDNVTENSISFHFTPSSELDTDWQVAIIPEGAEITENQIVNISDTFYTFTGLNHSSLYKIYVRNICEEDAFWNYISQYTECGPISEFPFVENFNVNTTPANVNLEFPRCWSRIGSNITIDNTFDVNSLKLGGINRIAVLPEIDSSIAVSDLQISFTIKYVNYTPSGIVVGVMDDPSDTSTFTPIDEVWSSPAQTWTFRNVPLNSYTGNGKYIALKSLNWTCVDDLVLDYISGCPFPTHVSITGVSNNSVGLTWTPTGIETEWQVIVVEQDSDTATAIPQATTSTSYTYNGLLPSTLYVAYVRAVCGNGGFSTWEKTDPFTTVCDPVSAFPIVENFDEFPIPTVYTFELPRPECWTFPELYGQNYPGVDFYESYSGTNSLKFIAGAGNSYASYTIHATAVSPMLDADIHQLNVRFMLKSNWLYYPEGMEVGVMSDPYDMNTFESVALIVPQTSDEWYEFLVEFDSTQISGSGNYIVFRYTSTYNQRFNWIDDIVIDYSSHVVIPPAPTNLVASNVTESTADLSWSQESSQVSGWKVEYHKNEESGWISLFVNDMSCHLSGLESDKQYVARVAAYLDGKFSEYSNECTFVTQGVGISDYLLEDKVSVYPNPAHNYVVINSENGVHISRYALYSIDGKLLLNVPVTTYPVQVPIDNLSDGVYFLEIVCDEGLLVKKIVKR